MKTSKLSPRKLEKIAVIHRWKVAGAFHSLNGMRLKAKVPKGQVNVVFLIVGMDGNLVIARISVEEAEVVRSCQSVQDLVDER